MEGAMKENFGVLTTCASDRSRDSSFPAFFGIISFSELARNVPHTSPRLHGHFGQIRGAPRPRGNSTLEYIRPVWGGQSNHEALLLTRKRFEFPTEILLQSKNKGNTRL